MNYFIYGSEQYLLKQELNKIIASNNDNDSISTVFYDGQSNDFNMDLVLEDANTISLFGDKKVIIVNNPDFLSGQTTIADDQLKNLDEYLHDSSVFTTLVFYYEMEDKLDQRKKIFKLLAKECRVINIAAITSDTFRKYVMKDLKQNNIKIDQQGIDELLSRLPINIINWKSELSKLSLYGTLLGKDEIRHLISRSLDDNVFILVNAVMHRNLKIAVDTWHDLAVMKHDPIELVAILASQFRFMYQCVILSKQYDNQKIADVLNAKLGRVNISLSNSRGVNSKRILSLLSSLADLDQKIKGGRLEKQLGFELFLIEATK